MTEQDSEILTSIIAALGASGLDEQLIMAVLNRLDSLGYTVQGGDGWVIGFSMQKVENSIKNSCATSAIPKGLELVAVDRVCGEFLYALKQTGKLDEAFALETAVKQVQAGDTNVTFAIGEGSQSPEQRLNALLSYLMTKGEGEFVCYRKIRW